MRRHPLMFLICGSMLMLAGCLQLDFVAHNARHCSVVGPDTCDVEESFDKLCTPCDEPYDWSTQDEWPEDFLTDAQSVRQPMVIERRPVKTTDGAGELDLYVVPSHGEIAEQADITVLIQHGNFGSIEHYLPRVKMFHELGYRVVIWDYRGYGKSTPESTPTPDEFIADAHQIRDLVPELTDTPGQLIIYGMSLGAIPSIEMALHTPPCAMILEVPFTSLDEVTKTNTGTSLGGGFLSEGKFENIEKIKSYTAPLMVLHASEDDLFPLESVKQVHDNAGSSIKEFHIIEGANHGIGDGVPEAAGLTHYQTLLDEFILPIAQTCPN